MESGRVFKCCSPPSRSLQRFSWSTPWLLSRVHLPFLWINTFSPDDWWNVSYLSLCSSFRNMKNTSSECSVVELSLVMKTVCLITPSIDEPCGFDNLWPMAPSICIKQTIFIPVAQKRQVFTRVFDCCCVLLQAIHRVCWYLHEFHHLQGWSNKICGSCVFFFFLFSFYFFLSSSFFLYIFSLFHHYFFFLFFFK